MTPIVLNLNFCKETLRDNKTQRQIAKFQYKRTGTAVKHHVKHQEDMRNLR